MFSLSASSAVDSVASAGQPVPELSDVEHAAIDAAVEKRRATALDEKIEAILSERVSVAILIVFMAVWYAGALVLPSLHSSISQTARSFIDACLNPDRHARPTIHELLSHPFIEDLGKT
jgi:serine/threonine protein kinase